MNSSLPRCLSPGLTLVIVIAAGSCATRSVIGQQTGQGGASGAAGMSGPGTGGQVIHGDGGSTGTGGIGTGTGGIGNGTGGAVTCPASAGSTGSGFSFSAAVEYPTHAGSFLVALGDLNGDGKPDLAVGNYMSHSMGGAGGTSPGTGGNGSTPSAGSVSVFLSSTAGYGPPQFYNLNTGPSSIVTGDLNGDGKVDVAVVNAQGVSVFFNDGSGNLLAPVSFATGTGPVWVALGDLNGDGKADLAVANQGSYDGNVWTGGDVAVLLNMGGGTFVAANYPAGASPDGVTMADLNGDGKADLAVASGAGVSVLLNNGGGTFGAPASYGSGTNPVSVAAGDLNGDGTIDLAVASKGGGASVLLNIGNGAFAAAVNYSYPGNPYNGTGMVVIGDLNGDGRPDLAGSVPRDSCSAVVVLLN